MKPAVSSDKNAKPFEPYCGLVVIGVLPAYRGKGIAQQLMDEFEERAKALHQTQGKLSVKKNNQRALQAYKKQGWYIGEEQAVTYVMHREIRDRK